jgi:hypothetical protein
MCDLTVPSQRYHQAMTRPGHARWLPALVWLVAVSSPADLIPYYRMDSYIFLSDTVIYVEELGIQQVSTNHTNWIDRHNLVRCRVLRTIKGTLARDMVIIVDYGDVFRRQFVTDREYDLRDRNGSVLHQHFSQPVPLGRALIFLKRDERGHVRPLTAKLIQKTRVLQYAQFVNPGPLVLFPQKPENIQLNPREQYGEAELLRDVEIARDKARVLVAPVRSGVF